MHSREFGVSRVARAVARGDGDWASVPAALREVIVVALKESSAQPLRSIRGRGGHAPYGEEGERVSGSPNAASAPQPLTEEAVQSSISTFEDAAWVRREAVRRYAEFHNNIESTYVAMRSHLRPVWRTAMQLHPDILADIRDEYHLSRRSEIPDGIPISVAASQHIALQEAILSEMEDTLQVLRNTSVRLAAHFLSDGEKVSLGANPAYLRASDIDREVVLSRPLSASTSPQRALAEGHVGRIVASAGSAMSGQRKSSASRALDEDYRASSTRRSHDLNSSSASYHQHRNDAAADRGSATARKRAGSGGSSGEDQGGGADALLEELRRLYHRRVRELKGKAKLAAGASTCEGTGSITAAASLPHRGARAHTAPQRSNSSPSTVSSASASSFAGSSSVPSFS